MLSPLYQHAVLQEPVFQDRVFQEAVPSEVAQVPSANLLLNHRPASAMSREHAQAPVRLGLVLAELARHYGLSDETALSELTTALPAGLVNLPAPSFEFGTAGLMPAIA